jgi:phage shock protein C
LDLDGISDEDLEALRFEEDDAKQSIWNAPTIAGLTIIVGGVLYLLNELGIWTGLALSEEAWAVLAGVLVILLGLGVLSWRPGRSSSTASSDEAADDAADESSSPDAETARSAPDAEAGEQGDADAPRGRKRLARPVRDNKLFGVCAGIARYLDLDPTLVRVAFVVMAVIPPVSWVSPVLYLGLAYAMPKDSALPAEDRWRTREESERPLR